MDWLNKNWRPILGHLYNLYALAVAALLVADIGMAGIVLFG